MVGVVASLALAACGSGSNQAANEPSGKFKVVCRRREFPSSQTLSQHAHLVLALRNAGSKAIPDLAVTICNVTCSYKAPKGEGSSAGAFASDVNLPYVSNPSRPIWVVDRGPGPCRYSCLNGGPGAYVTAYANTWALGHKLRPGQTVSFDWAVTAVTPGSHVVAWQVAAGLNGKAKAVLANGMQPSGTFVVKVNSKPQQSYVNNAGQIVLRPAYVAASAGRSGGVRRATPRWSSPRC